MLLSARQKLELLQKAQKGAKVAALCRKFGISRYTFYKYLKRWQKNPRLSSFKDEREKNSGPNHWRGASRRREKAVFEVILGHSTWSTHKIADFLTKKGLKISNHGVQGILERADLNKQEKRLEYQKRKEFSLPQILIEKFTPEEKLRLILASIEERQKPASICRQYGFSRCTFYKWLRRYQEAPERWQEGLLSRKPKGERHWRYLPQEKQKLVLDLIALHPEYSCHRLALEIRQIGHHGIQNLLYRNGLNTYQLRLAFSQGQVSVSQVQLVIGWLNRLKSVWQTFVPQVAPAPPPKIFQIFRRASPPFFVSLVSSSFLILIFLLWLGMFSGQPFSVKIGLFFASTALLVGSFFFLYSMKYYFTLALVLSFSTQSGPTSPEASRGERNGGGWLGRIFGIANGSLRGPTSKEVRPPQAGGLQPNLDHIKLKRYPFISIHLPFYNEKNVANRILAACTSMDYSNYEVIVCDDSTDETVEIVNEWSKHPKVKVLHRPTREGFKGGALREALKHMDKRAEFVIVFDADFVPYPDTLTQFMKYFKATGGWSEEKFCKAESIQTMPYETFKKVEISPQEQSIINHQSSIISHKSHIACVAGYQWHVLNKSENWITRGVRTEYAGSYVIERPGQEILGALKIIHGSVYCIRADILKHFGWGTSITEDFELTLRLYAQGFKVCFTPYIQAPSECVSTIKRLVRQRMRWAEGHSFNVKRRFMPIITSPLMTLTEKLEFLYISPYYLQAFFFLVGTFSWLISEIVFPARLPFWTSLWGWSLVLTNFLALPLMNAVGLFLEEGEEKDYLGIFSFVALSYLLVPFQAFAAVKGFIEEKEGPWFRTPKTGLITDIFTRGRFYRFIFGILGRPAPAVSQMNTELALISAVRNSTDIRANPYLALATANNRFQTFLIRPRHIRWIGNVSLSITIGLTILLSTFAPLIPMATSYASQPTLKTIDSLQQTANSKPFDPQLKTDGLLDHKNPPNKEELVKNALTEEITVPRAIHKTTKGGKNLEFIFHKEPRVRIKLSAPSSDGRDRENQEIEFETKKVFGQFANPSRATIFKDKEVVYEEIIPDVDLKYTLTNDLLVEEFILKAQNSNLKSQNLDIEQTVRTVNVKIISPHPTAFNFYSEDGQELFRLSQPFAKDAEGAVSNDVAFTLEKAVVGYTLTKTLGQSAQSWLAEPQRAYPVSIDPSVIVSGGIEEAEVQFGGLQRKVAFVNGNWYAFYNDTSGAGISVFYKKSSDGSSWGSPVDVDSSDTDNYNPSISVLSNIIIVFWIDTSSNAIQGRRIDTASADALGTLCTSASQGTLSNTFMVTVAVETDDPTEAIVAYSDTSTDTEVDIFFITGLGGACTITDAQPGAIVFGSGITSSDRPVLVPAGGDGTVMIFQDGDLSYSFLDHFGTGNPEWGRNNLTIASVADDVYAVTTGNTANNVWILTKSGTTAANLYSCCTPQTSTIIDSFLDGLSLYGDIDIACPTSDDCKIVYTDDISTNAPKLIFVDCDNEDCSISQSTTIDSDLAPGNNSNVTGNPAIYCLDSQNCKIVYGDNIKGNGPDEVFVDCTSANEECTTQSIVVLNTDIGDSATTASNSIYCPSDANCKVVYFEEDAFDLHFVDCSAADCSTTDADTIIDNNTSGIGETAEIFCVAADDCKVVFNDTAETDVSFIDCANESCTSSTQVDLDTFGNGRAAIWCPSTDTNDCKVVYFDAFGNEMMFVDCNDFDCAPNTTQRVDTDVRNQFSIACLSVTDCRFSYIDNASDQFRTNYIDCDSATCNTGSMVDMPNGRQNSTALACPASDNCKVIYINDLNNDLIFVDCDNEECFPTASDLADPWTGQTNVSAVSITYDSTNTDLYAMVIKDTDEKAYWKSSDAGTILWGGENDFGWSGTGDHLGYISSPQSGAGTSQIGAVLRETTNFEFAVVPEKTLILLLLAPFLPRILKKLRERKEKL